MIDETLTMIPGPTPVHPRILDALARPTTSHVAPRFVEAFRQTLERFAETVRASDSQPFVVSGSGTLAMEMALVNLLGAEDRLLVLSQGFFGDRWGELASAFGIPCDVARAEWGQVVAPDALARRLDETRYSAVAMTHVDTSTGAAAPVAAYAGVLRERGVAGLLDGVCATAGMDERFDEWGLDVLLTGAQKALGAPPGVALLVVSQRALERRRARASVPAFSADLLRWLPIMHDPSKYFSTPPVNEIVALNEALGLVLEEGLDRRFERHARIGRAMRAGMRVLGLQPFTEDTCLADTLSVACYPDGVDDAVFRTTLTRRGVVVAPALGAIQGRAFRVGHMGNIGAAEVFRTLDAFESTLGELGRVVEPGAAVSAAAPHLSA
ncbi:MAG: alanine--glyoxylate aminotransferase family protein [bacterium]|nr:alanine--glyoxylate aminotransferase family protein [bacterium]